MKTFSISRACDIAMDMLPMEQHMGAYRDLNRGRTVHLPDGTAIVLTPSPDAYAWVVSSDSAPYLGLTDSRGDTVCAHCVTVVSRNLQVGDVLIKYDSDEVQGIHCGTCREPLRRY